MHLSKYEYITIQLELCLPLGSVGHRGQDKEISFLNQAEGLFLTLNSAVFLQAYSLRMSELVI